MACRGIIASLAAVVLLGLTMRALADGKVFEVAGPPALIPEQSALIHYQGGIETLAIETRFAGKGLEFGWVVPLPARPEITPSTAGLFPTLRATAVPEIIQPVNLLWCLIVFFLAAWIFIGMKSRPVAIVLTVVVLVLGGALCLVPTLGRARGIGSEPGPDVRVLDRQIVGSFEVATLAADGAADLRRWLADNRFQVPAACDAALDAYARDRWVFAACKLRREQATGATFATHPLVFRFKTARAVYPMQLTGAGATEPVSLDLYVFADRSARCDGLEIERCLPTRGEWNKDAHIDAERAMPVWHPSLVALASTAPWMTKLVGTLSPGAMTHDLYLDWFEPRVIGAAAYSSSGATLVSSQWGATIAMILATVAAALVAKKRVSDPGAKRIAAVGLLVGFGVFALMNAWLPTVPTVRGGLGDRLRIESSLLGIATESLLACEKAGQPTFAGFRDAFNERTRVLRKFGGGSFAIEEDSPGNYTLREQDGYVFYGFSIEPARRSAHVRRRQRERDVR